MPSATPSSPPAANTTTISPRGILLGYQLRRENRALLDILEEQKVQAIAQAESQRLREEELERKIAQVQRENQEMEAKMQEKIHEMSEQLKEHDGEIRDGVAQGIRSSVTEIERSVVEQLSARLPSGTFAAATPNAEDNDGTQLPNASPGLPRPQQSPVVSAQPQPAPTPAFVPPHQRYQLRRAAQTAAAIAGPSSANNTAQTTNRNQNVDARANLSRKRSIAGTDTPATPALTRARSDSSSSTLSTAPSSSAEAEANIPDLPFNHRGTPYQANLGVDVYFAAAVKFARERQVNQESDEEQMTFILQIFKGMKKEEKMEIVAALEEVSLAKTDLQKRTVQFLGLWDDIAAAVDGDVLMEAKAKASLLRATAALVG